MPTADEMLNTGAVHNLAQCLKTAGAETDSVLRTASSLAGVPFSARVALVRNALVSDLPARFPEFRAVIERALAEPEFTGWMIMPVTEAVAVAGEDEFEAALDLLAALTPRLTAETAVRRFLNADLERALAVMRGWTEHPDEHVRRLASEGTRPRLPWAPRIPSLVADPSPALGILDALYRDSSEYVRRSVANHLNDVSKDNPDVAVQVAKRWVAQPEATTRTVVRHALRTLVKAGNGDALELLGYSPHTPLTVSNLSVSTPAVTFGGALDFAFSLTNDSTGPASIAVDYVIHHVKSNGARTPKVFKLATRTLAPAETWHVSRTHSIRPISTRRYYPGVHLIEIQVNGVSRGSREFILRM